MARLIVTALSEDTIAGTDNKQSNYIVVSVTDENGVPVAGLSAPSFQVDLIIGPGLSAGNGGGALANITSVTQGRLPGVYVIHVVPINTQTWKAGVYIFAIAVTQGVQQGLPAARQGQALASVLMD